MTKGRERISHHASYDDNPSRKKLEGVEVKKLYKPGDVVRLVDDDASEVLLQHLGKKQVMKVDTKPFKKVFADAFPMIKDLSIPALRVFIYIMHTLEAKSDWVAFSYAECMEFCNYGSRNNVYKGLLELLNKSLIYRRAGEESSYFINVNRFYNGRRI